MSQLPQLKLTIRTPASIKRGRTFGLRLGTGCLEVSVRQVYFGIQSDGMREAARLKLPIAVHAESEQLVATPSGPSAREFLASRPIAAPPSSVFAAFGDPARLAVWWGPAGFTSTFHSFEFESAGRWSFTMHGPDGKAESFDVGRRLESIVVPANEELLDGMSAEVSRP